MPRDLMLTALALFTWGIGEGMFIYFQPLYLEKWGANPVEIGAILGGMGIAMAVAQAPAGWLGDRIGSRPVMIASWVLGTIAALIMALANSLAVFVTGMLIYGLTSFVVAPMNSYITSVRGRWSVQRSLTIVSAMFHLGAVAGPIIGGLIGEASGLRSIYRISAVIFVLSTIIIFQTRQSPVEEQNESHAGQPKLLRNPRFLGLLALIFLTMFALYLPQPLTPNYLKDTHHFNLSQIGQLGAAGSFGNTAIMLAFGHLSAQSGLLIGQVFVGLFALLLWRGEILPVFFVGYFCVGGYRLARSMALAYARSIVKASEVGLAFGLVETGNAVATILAPLIAGMLYNRAPQSMYIAALAAISLVLLVNISLLPGRRSAARQVIEPEPVSPEPLPQKIT